MANYNSGRIYNHKLTDGGANYNSGPFTIMILDNGSGIDIVESIFSNVNIDDIATSDDTLLLIANISTIDNSEIASETVSVEGNVNVNEIVTGTDIVSSIFTNLNIKDSGIALDFASIAGAFFVIDSNNYLQPLGVLVTRDSRYELLPATRDHTEEIPGVDGEIDFGTDFKSRPMELQVATDEGYSPLQKSQLQRLFAKYLDPTKGAKTLIFSDDVEKTYIVKYSGKIDLTNYASWFEFVLPFKMNKPFIIGSFEKVLVGSGELVNNGTKETELIIEINGPSSNPSLTIGGETFSYNGTIPNGQSLVVDTKLSTAKLNNTNALGDFEGELPFFIQPGSTNVTAGNNVTIRWRDKWV